MGTFRTDYPDSVNSFKFTQEVPMKEVHNVATARCNSRWSEWKPLLIMDARKTADPADQLWQWQRIYFMRVRDLLNAEIRWPLITKHRLDDPRRSDELFEAMFRSVKRNVRRQTDPRKRRAILKLKEE